MEVNQSYERYFLRVVPVMLLVVALIFAATNSMSWMPGWLGAVLVWARVIAVGLRC